MPFEYYIAVMPPEAYVRPINDLDIFLGKHLVICQIVGIGA